MYALDRKHGRYSQDLVSVSSLVLLKTMMELKRLNHLIYQILSGSAYSSRERRLMGDCCQKIHDFSIVSMTTILKIISNNITLRIHVYTGIKIKLFFY